MEITNYSNRNSLSLKINKLKAKLDSLCRSRYIDRPNYQKQKGIFEYELEQYIKQQKLITTYVFWIGIYKLANNYKNVTKYTRLMEKVAEMNFDEFEDYCNSHNTINKYLGNHL